MSSPSPTSPFLRSFIGDWQSFHDLRRRGCSELVDMFLNLCPKLISVCAYDSQNISRGATSEGKRTIFSLSFKIHACGKHTLRTNRPLNFELILRGSFLHKFRLEYESGVSTVCGGGKTRRNFLLGPEQLKSCAVSIL